MIPRLTGLGMAFLLVISVLYAAAVFMAGPKPEKSLSGRSPADAGIDYERVTLTTADGLQMIGWFIPQRLEIPSKVSAIPTRHKPTATVIVGHGYPYEKSRALDSSLFLHKDFNLFYYDLRYFGESQGAYTTFGFREKKDLAVILDYLKSRPDVDPEAIGLMGTSLSAAIFIQAHPAEIRAMVLDSSFESLEKIVGMMYPFLPGPLKWPWVRLTDLWARLFVHIRLDQVLPLKDIHEVYCPVLFIHGLGDREIPPQDSRDLYNACPSKNKELWLVPGADHTQAYFRDPQAYAARVSGFFKKYLEGQTLKAGRRETKGN
jgi:fermentation-respiration switch protein FrsA (DUF1100 family)